MNQNSKSYTRTNTNAREFNVFYFCSILFKHCTRALRVLSNLSIIRPFVRSFFVVRLLSFSLAIWFHFFSSIALVLVSESRANFALLLSNRLAREWAYQASTHSSIHIVSSFSHCVSRFYCMHYMCVKRYYLKFHNSFAYLFSETVAWKRAVIYSVHFFQTIYFFSKYIVLFSWQIQWEHTVKSIVICGTINELSKLWLTVFCFFFFWFGIFAGDLWV